jgi:hypothetical protein
MIRYDKNEKIISKNCIYKNVCIYGFCFHCFDISGSNESQLGSIATFDTRREREREKEKDVEKDKEKERGKLVHEGSIRSVFSSSHASFESYSFQNGASSAVLEEASVSLSKAPPTGNINCIMRYIMSVSCHVINTLHTLLDLFISFYY